MKTDKQINDKARQQAWLQRRRAAHHAALETLRAPSCKLSGMQIWRKLRRLEVVAHAGTTAWCNGERFNLRPGTSFDFRSDEDASDQFCMAVTGEVEKIFGCIPDGFFVNGDARGYALKLDPDKVTVPEGMDTDWGRNGLLASVID